MPQYSCPFISRINVKKIFNCAKLFKSDNHSKDTCLTRTPLTLTNAPIIIAPHAAGVVPFSQYNPPIITAPDPPAKIAAVIAKNKAIF